eukprot:TRINITY_DN8928_c0_g1_i1.p1 TRINITY_DN8928_c0_g1~~TRINITY_DN8928_c0_g1_i1.p1  ORF type:complete len:228 (-),score=69.38 TRINITY_DN8928_c0_g1_i1:27-710(-)
MQGLEEFIDQEENDDDEEDRRRRKKRRRKARRMERLDEDELRLIAEARGEKYRHQVDIDRDVSTSEDEDDGGGKRKRLRKKKRTDKTLEEFVDSENEEPIQAESPLVHQEGVQEHAVVMSDREISQEAADTFIEHDIPHMDRLGGIVGLFGEGIYDILNRRETQEDEEPSAVEEETMIIGEDGKPKDAAEITTREKKKKKEYFDVPERLWNRHKKTETKSAHTWPLV